MRHHAVPFLALSAALLGAGCASEPVRPTQLQLDTAEVAYIDVLMESQQVLYRQVLARMEQKHQAAVAAGAPNEAVFDVLALSGGGAKGAFGAGFLLGWGQVTDPVMRRPQFDVVSGVSTGSLIAPMAFVGTDAAYKLADETYRNPSPNWVKERGLLHVLLNRDSFYTNDGLFKTICASIGPQIPLIAAGARENRTLIVAAVDLNQGLTRTWNMTDLACQVEQGKVTTEQFCQRSLASASIPLVFPPQEIDNNLYVDGSTTSDILLTLDAFRTVPTMSARWAERHPGVPLPKIRIWVIANTALFPRPVAVDSSDAAVLGRSLDLAVQAGLITQLKTLELFTALFQAEGMRFEFRFVSMPDGYTETGQSMFDADDMRAMSDMGVAMGRDPTIWRSHVPNLLVPVELREVLLKRISAENAAAPKATATPPAAAPPPAKAPAPAKAPPGS